MIASLVEAYDLGQRTARALRSGDVFTGAFGACVAARINRDSPAGRLFCQGYVDALPKAVVTDLDNRIVEI